MPVGQLFQPTVTVLVIGEFWVTAKWGNVAAQIWLPTPNLFCIIEKSIFIFCPSLILSSSLPVQKHYWLTLNDTINESWMKILTGILKRKKKYLRAWWKWATIYFQDYLVVDFLGNRLFVCVCVVGKHRPSKLKKSVVLDITLIDNWLIISLDWHCINWAWILKHAVCLVWKLGGHFYFEWSSFWVNFKFNWRENSRTPRYHGRSRVLISHTDVLFLP